MFFNILKQGQRFTGHYYSHSSFLMTMFHVNTYKQPLLCWMEYDQEIKIHFKHFFRQNKLVMQIWLNKKEKTVEFTQSVCVGLVNIYCQSNYMTAYKIMYILQESIIISLT